jgi:PAS domain S-box-containing protein
MGSLFASSVIDSLEDALVVTDRSLAVLCWNTAIERMTGVPRADALGRDVETVLPFARDADLGRRFRRALEGEPTQSGEVPYAIPDRARHGWMEARCVPWRDESGRVAGIAAFLTDVTARRQRRLMVGALEAIGHSLTSSLDLDEVLETIVGKALEVMSAESALVVSWDGVASELRVMRAAGRLSAEYARAGTIPLAGGAMSRAVREARPVSTANILADPSMRLSPERSSRVQQEGFKATAAAPLSSKGRVIGALAVHYWTERTFSEEEIAGLKILAEQAAVAIDNARLYADATRRADRLRDLAEVERIITASLDVDEVLHRIASAAAGLTPGALAAVHVFDVERDTLVVKATSSSELHEVPADRPARAGLSGMVAETRAPVLVADPVTHPRTLASAWWTKRPRATYYGVPILMSETFVGVLDFILPSGLPDAEAQEVLRLLAAHAGVAISNASLFQRERIHLERIRALAGMNQRISSALDLDQLLAMIAESAAKLSGVTFASFWLADGERQTLTLTGGSVAEIADDLPQRVARYDEGGVGWIARHRASLTVDDALSDPRMLRVAAWWHRWGLKAFAGFPVLAGDELLAVLVLTHSQPITISPELCDVLAMFIGQAGVAIQNARLFREAQRRRDVAEALARLGRDLTATLDAERIGELVTRGIVELLNVKRSVLFRYEPAAGTLHAIAGFGSSDDLAGYVVGPGEGLSGRAVADRKIVTSVDVLNDPSLRIDPAGSARLRARGVEAAAAVPLLTHERIVGALAVGAERGREFSRHELETLQIFADRAVLALENARLYATARDSLNRFRETQAQLIQAGKMSALGQLVSGVAHELNNPLSVIIGYGQLLLSRDLDPEARRPVDMMVSQADRMAKIVRNLLFFSRQRPPERVPVAINEVIEQTLALRINQLRLSGIDVQTDFAPKLPGVAGDTHQLQQVFLNLLLNAEQAITESRRGGRIVFRTRPLPEGKGILAQVIDDGPGIPADVLPRIFEPFFTTKEVGAGTGLGLSVSYGIAEEHHGRLYAESRPGETIFNLELPAAPPVIVSAVTKAPAPPVHFAGRTALVVEDDAAVVDLVMTLLGQGGWRVDVASTGKSGLGLLRGRPYDLIVSDIRMPNGSGQHLYENALAHDLSLRDRFIFITGDTANPEAAAFLKDSGVPIVEKPFQPIAFLEAVHRVASRLPAVGRG